MLARFVEPIWGLFLTNMSTAIYIVLVNWHEGEICPIEDFKHQLCRNSWNCFNEGNKRTSGQAASLLFIIFSAMLVKRARPGSNAFPKRNKLLMSCKCHLENNVYDITKGAANTVSPRIWLSLLNVRKAIMFVVLLACAVYVCVSVRDRGRKKK